MPNLQLNYTQQHQQQDYWCWAAVNASIDHFYRPGAGTTQCELANTEFGQASCCIDGSKPQCNKTAVTGDVLQRMGHLRTQINSAAAFEDVDQELTGGHPVGARIEWAGGGAHAVVISGIGDTSDEMLTIDDPWYGRSQRTYLVFSQSYQGNGRWTRTWLTQQ